MTEIQLVKAGITLLIYLMFRYIIHRSIDSMVLSQKASKTRSKVVRKAINVTMLLVLLAILFSIFGVDQSELLVFIGSVFTILGIALFAQWYLLSNITAGVIIFFNHTVSMDDTVSIIDKDYEIEGRISDIGLLFVVLKTTNNEVITVPNNIFIQKMIKNRGKKVS